MEAVLASTAFCGEALRDAGVAGLQTVLARGAPGARLAGALQQAGLLIFAIVAEVGVDGDQVALGVFDAMNDAAARADALRLFARQHLIIVLAAICLRNCAGAKNLALRCLDKIIALAAVRY